jgi:hypothetical protein
VNPRTEFRALMTTLAARLRNDGFRRRGNSFCRRGEDGNYEILEVQKSSDSTPEKIVFTINLGTFLARLGHYFPARQDPPSIADCHWRERLGFVLPGDEDRWWSIEQSADVPELADALCDAIQDYGLPALERFSKDESLRDLWLSGCAPNLTDMQRLMHLSALLTEMGATEALPSILGALREISSGQPYEGIVRRHLSKLNMTRRNAQ